MAFLAQYLAIAPSVAKSTAHGAMEALELIEGTKVAQSQLQNMAASLDERAMPRDDGAPSKELDVACVRLEPLRKKQRSNRWLMRQHDASPWPVWLHVSLPAGRR